MSWLTATKNELLQQRDVFASYIPRKRTAEDWNTIPGDLITRVLNSGRPWEGWLTPYIERYASPELTSFDVGANIGAHTRAIARHSYETIALEPQAAVFECLAANVRDEPRVRALHAAASDHAGTAALLHEQGNTGGGQLVKDGGDETVDLIRLDDLALERPVGFMKIDVERHEREVFGGAQRILTEDRPVIILEDLTRSREVLIGLGYRVSRISLADYLCLP